MAGQRLSFVYDASGLTESIDKYADAVRSRKSRIEVVRGQLKLAVKGLIALTPFETLAQGRQSVHSDLRKAVKPYGGEDGSFSEIRNTGLRQRLVSYLRGGNTDAIRDIFFKLSGNGFYASYEMKDFSPSLHHSAQNARGRVVKDGFVLVPQVAAWKEYLRSLQSQVGRARGGWVDSANAMGLKLPDWVMRHSDGGAYKERITDGTLEWEMINRAIFIPDYKSKIAVALQGREAAMLNDLRRMLEGAKTHAGL